MLSDNLSTEASGSVWHGQSLDRCDETYETRTFASAVIGGARLAGRLEQLGGKQPIPCLVSYNLAFILPVGHHLRPRLWWHAQ